jgi:hypothetical protein
MNVHIRVSVRYCGEEKCKGLMFRSHQQNLKLRFTN